MANPGPKKAKKKNYVVLRVENGNQVIATPKGEVTVPIPVSYREKYGWATPGNIEMTPELEAAVKSIMAAPEKMIVRYIRKDPETTYVPSAEPAEDQDGNQLFVLKTLRSRPYGAVIAFNYEGKVYLGWSLASKLDILASAKKTRPEGMDSVMITKKDALHAAVVRGLQDSFTKDAKKHYVSKLSGSQIPSCIEEHFATFFDRIGAYFKEEALVNVEV